MSIFAADLVVRRAAMTVSQKVSEKITAKREAIKAERDAIKAELNNDSAPQE
jgi:hypothetical protein